MATITEALAIAVEHHQAGRLAEAEALYRDVLANEPNNANALHLLGVIAKAQGSYTLAAEYIGKALNFSPDNWLAHFNLGTVYQDQRRLAEAASCFRRAIGLNPTHAASFASVHST